MQDAIEETETIDPEWNILSGGFNQTFDCWFRQMGHPLVTIQSENGIVTLSQSRFLHEGNETVLDFPESSLEYKWNIPIFYVNGLNEYKVYLFI